jgi:hypothetical protein
MTSMSLLLASAVLLAGAPEGGASGAVTSARRLAPAAVIESTQGTGTSDPTRLDLAFDTALPGSEVSLPLSLEVPPGVRVGRTVSEIEFPTGTLTFVAVRPGVAADVAEATVEAVVRADPKRAGLSILTVTTASAGAPIPSGIIAMLAFKVSAEAKPGATIVLPHAARGVPHGSESRLIEPVVTRNGEIKIESATPAVIACFFYLH